MQDVKPDDSAQKDKVPDAKEAKEDSKVVMLDKETFEVWITFYVMQPMQALMIQRL